MPAATETQGGVRDLLDNQAWSPSWLVDGISSVLIFFTSFPAYPLESWVVNTVRCIELKRGQLKELRNSNTAN